MNKYQDNEHMVRALELARKAYDLDEVPVGAVIVKDHSVIAEAYNLRENTFDPTAHAEILAIRKASLSLRNWRLTDADLYVTKEPCIMCCGAIVHARIRRVIYGCRDEKGGGSGSLYNILDDCRLNHRVEIKSGMCEKECAELLKRFFREKRV